MNETQALQIVRALADGVDPESGEVYPPQSPYQKPDTVRALFVATRALERASEWEQRKKRLPANTGKPWTPQDDARLAESFDGGMPILELAREHQRTLASVRARLIRMGKIPA
jgi:hypothetical protein